MSVTSDAIVSVSLNHRSMHQEVLNPATPVMETKYF